MKTSLKITTYALGVVCLAGFLMNDFSNTVQRVFHEKSAHQAEQVSLWCSRLLRERYVERIVESVNEGGSILSIAASISIAKDVYGRYPEFGHVRGTYPDGYTIPIYSDWNCDFYGSPYILEEAIMLYSSGLDSVFGNDDDWGMCVECVDSIYSEYSDSWVKENGEGVSP